MVSMNLSLFLKKHSVAEGDHVCVQKGAAEFKGTIIPSSDDSVLVLKLDNGYNVGLELQNISSVKHLAEGRRVSKAPLKPLQKNPALPSILILHTGGTIASRVDYRTGAVSTSFEPADLVSMFPALAEIANIRSRLLANMFSEDMRFAHYELLCKEIEKEIQSDSSLKGIIVTHGTDTLAYTSAALAFALQHLPLPVILVGAQRSSDRPSSDASDNLLAAALLITKTDFAGVGICMHETANDGVCVLLPACKTRKLHSSRRDAFKAVNAMPLARILVSNGSIEWLDLNYPKKSGLPLVVLPRFEEKVALVKVHPNFSSDQLSPFENYKGLVIEGTGLGQMPIGVPNDLSKPNKKNFDAIRKIISNGCIVVMTSQTVFGRVQMHVYSGAVDLTALGVIPGEDMLSETAFIKLAWLLGNFKDAEEIKRLMKTNLAGEISDFSHASEAFL